MYSFSSFRYKNTSMGTDFTFQVTWIWVEFAKTKFQRRLLLFFSALGLQFSAWTQTHPCDVIRVSLRNFAQPQKPLYSYTSKNLPIIQHTVQIQHKYEGHAQFVSVGKCCSLRHEKPKFEYIFTIRALRMEKQWRWGLILWPLAFPRILHSKDRNARLHRKLTCFTYIPAAVSLGNDKAARALGVPTFAARSIWESETAVTTLALCFLGKGWHWGGESQWWLLDINIRGDSAWRDVCVRLCKPASETGLSCLGVPCVCVF